MLLHTFTATPNNRKVEAFVRHFDLAVDVRYVSFRDRETQTAAFRALNPMGKVPVLVDGGFRLWESNAILTYLATVFAHTRALPDDVRGRADVDRWLHWQSCHLTPAMAALKGADERDFAALGPLLGILEQRLADDGFMLGPLTVVDFALAPYLMTRLGRQLDYGACPRVLAWRERVGALKGFRATEVRSPPPVA
jgi:glutathione S-transferase